LLLNEQEMESINLS